MATTAPTTFDAWIKSFQEFLSAKLAGILAGAYGPWFRGYFGGDEKLFAALNGTSHGDYYCQNRATSGLGNYLSVPLQKMRADELLALTRDVMMVKGNRLSFYRSQVNRLQLLSFSLDLTKHRIANLEKVS
jgi:hypothetical protein